MSKCIAITQRVEYIEAVQERRDALSQEWAALAEACGFLPLLLPNRRTAAVRMLERWRPEGILLTGGNDLAVCGGDAPERDELEHMLIRYAVEQAVPLLGVCRGMQMVLDHFGGRLQRVEGHVCVEHPLSNGDQVNSFHRWGAVECPSPLVPTAWSANGVLEAVRHREFSWIYAIMWHPERYHPFRTRDLQFIREVFQL